MSRSIELIADLIILFCQFSSPPLMCPDRQRIANEEKKQREREHGQEKSESGPAGSAPLSLMGTSSTDSDS